MAGDVDFGVNVVSVLGSYEPFPQCWCSMMVRNIPNGCAIEEFTEEIDKAGFIEQYNFLLPADKKCLCLALMNLLLSVAPLSSTFVTTLCREVGQMVTGQMTESVKTVKKKPSHALDTASTWSSVTKA